MARPPLFFQRLLLIVIATSVFGAGVVDVLCADVIPLRPYTGIFQTDFKPIRAFVSHGLVGDLFGAMIIIVLGSSLFATVANLSTGRTIAHAGFTPNPNITSTAGMVPVIQLVPFVFGAMILAGVYAVFERHLPGGL